MKASRRSRKSSSVRTITEERINIAVPHMILDFGLRTRKARTIQTGYAFSGGEKLR
jgi:hypothetical protein